MLEIMKMARFMLSWPNRPIEMRYFAVILYLLIILNYSTSVNSLDIFVSQVGPGADFHPVTSGRLHVDEGRNKVKMNIYHRNMFRNSFVPAMYLWRPLQL
jgi:hypothetical protein